MRKENFETQLPIQEAEKKEVLELKPEEKDFLDELLDDVYNIEQKEDKSDKMETIIKVADRFIETGAIKTGIHLLNEVSEEDLVSLHKYSNANLRNRKIAAFLKVIDYQKEKNKDKGITEVESNNILKEISNNISAFSSLGESVWDKNLAEYALLIAKENKERAHELFNRVQNKTPYLKELLDLNFKDLIQKQKTDKKAIEALLKYGELELAEKWVVASESNNVKAKNVEAIRLVAEKLIDEGQYNRAFSLVESTDGDTNFYLRIYRAYCVPALMEEILDKIITKKAVKNIPDCLKRFAEFIRSRTEIAVGKTENKENPKLEAEIEIADVIRRAGDEKMAKEILEKCYESYAKLSEPHQIKLASELRALGLENKYKEIIDDAEKSMIKNLRANYYRYSDDTEYLFRHLAEIREIPRALELLKKFLSVSTRERYKDRVTGCLMGVLIEQGDLKKAESLKKYWTGKDKKWEDAFKSYFRVRVKKILTMQDLSESKLAPVIANLEQILKEEKPEDYADALLIYAQKLLDREPQKTAEIVNKLAKLSLDSDNKEELNRLQEKLLEQKIEIPALMSEIKEKKIRPGVLDMDNLKNYLKNQIQNPSPELQSYLFDKDDIYSILTKYAKFEREDYKYNRDRNQRVFDERLSILYKKFGNLTFKLLDHQSFRFGKNGQPYLAYEEFEKIINSLNENKIKTILPYLEKGDLDKNYELKELIFEYVFGPEIERKKTKEKKTMPLEKYFENIDIEKRKELKNKEPGLYYQYVIYRYLKFLKWKYKTESFEELTQQLGKDKNERGLFLTKEFLRIKDKPLGKSEIKLAYIGKKKEMELHRDWYDASQFNVFKMEMNALEKNILTEAEAAKGIIEKVEKLGKDNIVIAVPNRRMAWIYEHLLTDWEDDPYLFKNKEDKMLFKLESALLSQEYRLRDQDIYLPLTTIRTAMEWLNKGKINHFVYVFKGIKYSSTPSVYDSKDLWSIDGRGFKGYVQQGGEYSEPSESVFKRAALRQIAESFEDIPLVFIDITEKSSPHAFEKIKAHIPGPTKRLHLISLTTGAFRDNIIELLGSDYWEALNYGHPNKGDKSNWHYLPTEKIKTTRDAMPIGKYYVKKIKEEQMKIKRETTGENK